MWYFVQTNPMLNALAPLSDQDSISPYNDNTVSNRQAMRKQKHINDRKIRGSNTNFSYLKG